MPFLPLDAADVLRSSFADSESDRCHGAAGAVAREQDRGGIGPAASEASERVVASMQATVAAVQPGMTKHDVVAPSAPGRNQPRPQFRILPDFGRHEPQPRAVGSGAGCGRYHVAGLRRQLSRLYRRSLPHGHSRRAGCRTEGSARPKSRPSSRRRANRSAPARGAATFTRRRRGVRIQSSAPISNSLRTAWGWSVTRRRISPQRVRCLIRP